MPPLTCLSAPVRMKQLALCREEFLDLDTGAFSEGNETEESDLTAPYQADIDTPVFKQPGLIPLTELAASSLR